MEDVEEVKHNKQRQGTTPGRDGRGQRQRCTETNVNASCTLVHAVPVNIPW